MTHTTDAGTSISALSRWDNEGGATTGRKPPPKETIAGAAVLSDAELRHLRMRVIALENVIIALLAQTSAPALAHVCALAAAMRPRANRTRHRLTMRAADHMLQLLDRAAQLEAIVE